MENLISYPLQQGLGVLGELLQRDVLDEEVVGQSHELLEQLVAAPVEQGAEVALLLHLSHQAVVAELHLREGLVDEQQELPDVIVVGVGLRYSYWLTWGGMFLSMMPLRNSCLYELNSTFVSLKFP